METTTDHPFEFESGPQVSTLSLNSSLNDVQWGDVERVGIDILRQLESLKNPALLVDLSRLEYIGSAQVALLVRIWKWIKNRNGRMVVVLTSPMVREVLTIAGLHTLWEIVDSREAAFRALGLQGNGQPVEFSTGLIVGVVALSSATIGLILHLFWGNKFGETTIDPKLILSIQLIFSAIALVAGAITVVGGKGVRRGLGVGMVVAGTLIAAVGVLNLPR